MSESDNSREIALRVEGLTKKSVEKIYGDGLEDVSFSFGKKGIHGVLAPKGSGKSLLMNILAGCEDADVGSVSVFGASVSSSAIDVKKRIGYVQKECVFYPNMTVTEIMSFVGETKRVESGKLYRQVKEALELTGLDGIKNKLVRNMTEFDKKKLAVAASLLGNPDILLFDRLITLRMNSESASELMGILQMLGKMKTVVVTTESYKLAKELCEDVVILSDGRVIAHGAFEELEARLRDSRSGTTLEALYNSLISASVNRVSRSVAE